jgi:hypothetical protein
MTVPAVHLSNGSGTFSPIPNIANALHSICAEFPASPWSGGVAPTEIAVGHIFGKNLDMID